MKKIVLGLAVTAALTMAVAPAMAATQWNFGASLKYATFWTEQDAGKTGMKDLQAGGAGLKNDGLLDWSTQGNSNIQMYMRGDNLEGYIELEYDFDGNSVTTSQYWGKYKFNDMAYIAIGQQEQLFNQNISSQVWGGDLAMNGLGTAYAKSTPKITVGYGGFAFALSKPYTDRVDTLRENMFAQAWVGTGMTDIDVDTYFPQLQASYEYAADTWRVKLAGAYQYTKFNHMSAATPLSPVYTVDSKSVNSWLVGLDGDINFGPLFLAAAASVGQNWSDAGWNDEDGCISDLWTGNYIADNFGVVPVYQTAVGFKDVYSWKSTTNVMVSVVAAYQLTEVLRFEAGAGYRYDRNKAFAKNSNIWNVYLQAGYTVAPGFIVTPEIGYVDMGKNVLSKQDQGYLWYAGAQWRMDF